MIRLRNILFFTLTLQFISCDAANSENELANEVNTDWLISNTSAYPANYSQPCQFQGCITEITYTTEDYADASGETRTNSAYVYTPYDYDESMQYNVLYLVHGHYGDQSTYFTVNGGEFVNVLDNMIANGDVAPIIVVTPTYNYGKPTQNYVDADKYCKALPTELVNDLMPIIESRYSTYAVTANANGFEASREHRAIGGFSMGAVTTWYAFDDELPYFKYFLPFSGDCWSLGAFAGMNRPDATARYLAEKINQTNYSGTGFYVWAAAGTSDSAYSETLLQIQGMARLPETFNEKNMSFHQKQGASHEYRPTFEYLYNALPMMFTASDNSGIRSVNIDSEHNPDFYDLSGLKVSKPLSKGIYISNQKKILIK
jgi:enterochelin esterase-like enzyme